MTNQSSPKIVFKNVIVNIKGKKYKLTINVPLEKVVEALEQHDYYVFKVKTLQDGTEIMQKISKEQ